MSSSSERRRGLPTSRRMRHSSHFVDRFDGRNDDDLPDAGDSFGLRVEISALEPDPNQPRSYMGDLSELVRSIQLKGVLEPILVRPRPATEDVVDAVAEAANDSGTGAEGAPKYRIISGERRFRAAQEAGLAKVPVIVMEVSETEALEIALIENLQRKDLTPFEEAEGYQRLAELHDYTHEQIADAVGKSRTVVTESFALLQMPAKVREIVQALGITSKSVLLEVLKADSEEEMIRLLEAVAEQGLNRDDLRKRFRKGGSGKGPAAARKKPYTFKFKAPDKTYSLALSFRKSTVDKDDLISALEQILTELREAETETL